MGTFYHRHEAYELYLFLRGNVNFYIENSCYHLQRGDLLVLNPEEMHRSFSQDESEYERITINLQKNLICTACLLRLPRYPGASTTVRRVRATSFIWRKPSFSRCSA
ncbi:AraC family ligand binding domain-containing protein [Paenibacillus rhizoplanae]